MKVYKTVVSLLFQTTEVVEGNMEEYIKRKIKGIVESQGIDYILDGLEFSDTEELELSEEEFYGSNEEEFVNSGVLFSANSLKEFLVAVAGGIVDDSVMSPDEAQKMLDNWDNIMSDTPTDEDEDKDGK